MILDFAISLESLVSYNKAYENHFSSLSSLKRNSFFIMMQHADLLHYKLHLHKGSGKIYDGNFCHTFSSHKDI